MTAVVWGLVAALAFIAIKDGLVAHKMGMLVKERDELKRQISYDIRLMPDHGKMPDMDAWYVKVLICGHDRRIFGTRAALAEEMRSRFNQVSYMLLDELYGEVK